MARPVQQSSSGRCGRKWRKVTWPSRKETGVTTAMVFVMVFVAALFFFVVDQIMAQRVRFVLGLGA